MRHIFIVVTLFLSVTLIGCSAAIHTESDLRKQETLTAACVSLTGLIEAGTLTDPKEVAEAFRIETANLRNDKSWSAKQQRIETALRNARSVNEARSVLRNVR